jgi:hypothetical protein
MNYGQHTADLVTLKLLVEIDVFGKPKSLLKL